MKIKGMAEFQQICIENYVKQYNSIYAEKFMTAPDSITKKKAAGKMKEITEGDVFVVWSVKVLQNFKALLSDDVDGDGIYAEYTYNGDKEQLYEDFYEKLTNRAIE